MESLTKFPWLKYDNNYFRPNFNQLEYDIPWMVDNMQQVCEAVQTLKKMPRGKKEPLDSDSETE